MREAKTKEINGVKYTVNLLPATPSFELLYDLASVVAPALGPLFSNVGSLAGALDKEVAEVRLDFVGQSLEKLLLKDNKELVKRVMKSLAEVTVMDPGGALARVYEMHAIQQGWGVMLTQWLPFALEVQYGDFSGALGNVMRSLPSALPVTMGPKA